MANQPVGLRPQGTDDPSLEHLYTGLTLPTSVFQPSSTPTASLMAQWLKNLPATQETQVRSSGWEDLLEEEMATHSSILAQKIPWTEESGGLQSIRLHRVGHN